jgi:hypothetical protein
METNPLKNNLDQEELLFKEQNKTKVPDAIEQTLDAFLYTTEFKSEEAVLRKFAFGYVMSTIIILGFFHQMGSGWFNFNIGSVLDFMGVALKQLINGVCFNALAVAAVLTISFDKKDLTLLLEHKEKIVYGLTFFVGLVLAMFGSEFTWSGLFLWLTGAAFGAGLGLNFAIKFINEKL